MSFQAINSASGRMLAAFGVSAVVAVALLTGALRANPILLMGTVLASVLGLCQLGIAVWQYVRPDYLDLDSTGLTVTEWSTGLHHHDWSACRGFSLQGRGNDIEGVAVELHDGGSYLVRVGFGELAPQEMVELLDAYRVAYGAATSPAPASKALALSGPDAATPGPTGQTTSPPSPGDRSTESESGETVNWLTLDPPPTE